MNLPVWHRLRERKLVQWALTYAAGAWVLLQVAEHPRLMAGLGAVHARAARTAEARALLERLRTQRSGPVEPFLMALTHAALGNLDEAFGLLQRAPLRGDHLIYLRSTPTFRTLRADPRYPRLLKQWGLPR